MFTNLMKSVAIAGLLLSALYAVVPAPAHLTSLWLTAACLMLFMFSVILSRSNPPLSVLPITSRAPRSEAL